VNRPADDLHAARRLLAAIDVGVVEEVLPWAHGTALLTPSLPKVWDANYMRYEDDGELDPRAIADEASSIAAEAGIGAATIVVEDEDAAARLDPVLRELGFETTRLVLMRLRETPAQPTEEVVEVPFAAVRSSRRQLMLEAFPGDEEVADQLVELDRRLEPVVGGQWFAVRDDGEILARAWLRGDGGVGQVEDVATAIGARGRGLARAVVSAAARASVETGDELTFVVADADETTPELYRKLGFEPMGLTHRFVRPIE
jgi:ribosomal protein S18 acetylase RimI-like enzyme